MGVNIIVSGTDEVGYFVGSPVPGLVAAHLIDTDATKATKNFIRGGAASTIVGMLAFEGDDPPTLVARDRYINTGLKDLAEHTTFTVARLVETGASAAMWGGLTASGNAGSNAWSTAAGTLQTNARYVDTNGSGAWAVAQISGAFTTNWCMICTRVSSADVTAKDLTRDLSATTAFSGTRVTGNNDVLVGSFHATGYAAGKKIASWWRFNRALSDGEIAEFAAIIRAREAAHGRTV